MNNFSEHFDRNKKLLANHKDVLRSLCENVTEERKGFINALEKGSDILKYDSGTDISDTGIEQIPNHPQLLDKEYKIHEDVRSMIEPIVAGVLDITHDLSNVNLQTRPPVPPRPQQHIYKINGRALSFDTLFGYRPVEPVTRDLFWGGTNDAKIYVNGQPVGDASSTIQLLTRNGKSYVSHWN